MRGLVFLFGLFVMRGLHADSVVQGFNDTKIDAASVDGMEADEERALKGSVELGYLASSGNTETESLNSRFALVYELPKWRHGMSISAYQASENNQTTAERYQLLTKNDRILNEREYVFFAFNYERDRFSGVEQRTSEIVGYGRNLIRKEKHLLQGEVGAGLRQSENSDFTTEDEAIAYFGLNYNWQISATAVFEQRLVVEKGQSNTYSESFSALSAKLLRNLALQVSYTIKRNSDVPVGKVKKDTYTAVSVVYAF